MGFFKTVLAAFIGVAVFFLVSLLFGLGLVSGVVSDEEVVVPENAVLKLNLNRPFAELEKDEPIDELPLVGASPNAMGMIKLKNTIAEAKNDEKIKGIMLDLSVIMTSYAHIDEIREALIDFKSANKFVVAYSEYYTQKAYYLASIADAVYINPEGTLEFFGLNISITFFKGMLDKLDIKPQIFRVGDYKSAVEPYMREDMSEANRTQLKSLLDGINDYNLQKIGDARGIPFEQLKSICHNMATRDAASAKKNNLVDALFYTDQVKDNIRERLGIEADEKIGFISYNKYKKTLTSASKSKNKVAVVVAEGTIVSGKGTEGTVGADRFIKSLRKAVKDEQVKAIVLRISSPGGSFMASDVMWREIQLAKKEKPVIASMSNIAASGGYYLAMGCDTIVAHPNTITGSIGIFGLIFNMSDFLKEKVGITNDMVKTGDYSSPYTLTRPLSEAEGNIIQQEINHGYDVFTRKAAEGRGMPVADLKAVASGRVWTGAQALENGLVDVLGGFDDAVAIAADKGGVADDYKIRYYPEPVPFFERLFKGMDESARTKAMKQSLGALYPYAKQLSDLKHLQGAQARMPYTLEFK